MKQVASLLGNYEEYIREVGIWQLQIIAYQLGHKYVCIINNLDPGATICRVSASTRCEALKKALEEVNARLSQVEVIDLPEITGRAAPQRLSRLEYRSGEDFKAYSVNDFLALPLTTRMQIILSGSLVYRDEDNGVISADLAMRLLGEASSSMAVAA